MSTAALWSKARREHRPDKGKRAPIRDEAQTQVCIAECAAYRRRRVVAEAAEMGEQWTPAENAQAVKAWVAACQKGWNPPLG
jgi:hypothetical protein